MKTGAKLISEKRDSHEKKGYDYAHDSQHDPMQFINAAKAYMFNDRQSWPFDVESFNTGDQIENLVNAGSMIAAAIDLLQRYKVGSVYRSHIGMTGTYRVIKVKVLKTHVAVHFVGISGDLSPIKQRFMLGSEFDLYSTFVSTPSNNSIL